MRSFNIIFITLFVAFVAAEPPRLRFRSFARQEVAEGEGDKPAEGYNYEAPPESRRLRLPEKSRLRPFARQEESSGYNYPKPTESYGPPPEDGNTATEPTNEYGAPTTDNPDDVEATTNPQVETLKTLQASQFRRRQQKAKFTVKPKQFQFQQIRTQQAIIQPQPIVYVAEYPYADLIEPEELLYVFKK